MLMVSVFLIFGCEENKSDKNEKKELQEITVKLKYFHQAQFTGNYVAKEKGFLLDFTSKIHK